MNNAFALRSVRLALSLVLPFIFPSLLNAASYENFEGPYTVRNFNVHYYTNGRHRVHSVRFPHFDALVNKPPQNIHFSIADFSAHSNVSTVAQIRQDPVNARNHALWLKATCCVPGQTGGRNEMHFRKPYDSPSMPNGMTYTFAMRFNVESLGTGTIMQGFSKFPWLRLMVRNGVNLYLNLAQCKDGIPYGNPKAGCGSSDWKNWRFTEKKIGSFRWHTWNTVVVNVLHSTKPDQGKIEVTLNGKKLVWTGRTTFTTSDTSIPFFKFGPYTHSGSVYFDDVHVIAGWNPNPLRRGR